MSVWAFDTKRTISVDELSSSYGTINKKYDDKPIVKPLPEDNTAPRTQTIEPGSFAFSMGNDAAQTDDFESAISHWQMASNAGNFFANWQLARFYLGAFKNKKNDSLAIKYLQLVVQRHSRSVESRVRRIISADAMVELSHFYTNGSVPAKLEPDLTIALRLLNLASASVGHSKANYILGDLYFSGKHVKAQKKRAVRYFTLAARKNHYSAQIKLGQIYYLQGRNIDTRILGLAWLFVARNHNSVKLQEYADSIIQQNKGKKLGKKRVKAANKIAQRISKKWNF